MTSGASGDPFPWISWQARILPYVEQQTLWLQAEQAYQQDPSPFDNPPHGALATVLPLLTCGSDPRVRQVQTTHQGLRVALTSYIGINGTDFTRRDGVLFADSHVPFSDITDGLSRTLMAGERPPSPDFWYGWWYAAVAQQGSGSPDVVLGVREVNQNAAYLWFCPGGPYHFGPGQMDNECDVMHFWSLHRGGSNFLFADGSVRFLTDSADSVLPALATRKGGEIADLP